MLMASRGSQNRRCPGIILNVCLSISAFRSTGNQQLLQLLAAADIRPERYDIPGDISSAAFFIVAALLVPGSEIVLKGIGVNPTRTGIIDILQAMGGMIELQNIRTVCGEPVADIFVRASRLKGIMINGGIIPRAIDEIPVVAIAAACAEGTTVISDAAELRVKESDRIATMTSELKKCGVTVQEHEDGMIITGAEQLAGSTLPKLRRPPHCHVLCRCRPCGAQRNDH